MVQIIQLYSVAMHYNNNNNTYIVYTIQCVNAQFPVDKNLYTSPDRYVTMVVEGGEGAKTNGRDYITKAYALYPNNKSHSIILFENGLKVLSFSFRLLTRVVAAGAALWGY